MGNISELELRNHLEKTITESINDIIKTFQDCPMYYLNEEDIRCDLYRKISNNYAHKIFLKNPCGRPFLTDSVHADAIHRLPNETSRQKPDLLAYFAINSYDDPISVITSSRKPENVYFLKKSEEIHNKKKMLVEIKFTDHRKSSDKAEEVIEDLNKIFLWESWKKYILYFDRSNKLNEKKEFNDIINIMKKNKKENEGDIEFYYLGMPRPEYDKKGQIYQYTNGIKIRDERFDLSHY